MAQEASLSSSRHVVRWMQRAYLLLHASLFFLAIAPWMFAPQAAWFICAGMIAFVAAGVVDTLLRRAASLSDENWLEMFPAITACGFFTSATVYALSQWVEPFGRFY